MKHNSLGKLIILSFSLPQSTAYFVIGRICFLLIFISFTSAFAQEPILVLEAENAGLTLPSKVKYVNGYSGNAYVGDNDPGGSLTFKNVTVDSEGTYEFRTFYTSMHKRSIAIQSGFYPVVVSTCPRETEGWDTPPVDVMYTYIYLNKGNNTIKITPHNGGAPNMDKFEIWPTSVVMPRPEIRKNAFSYDITDDSMIRVGDMDATDSNLNDNDEFSVYKYEGTSAEVYIECDMPYLITGYLLSPGAESSQNVKTWKLEYATDGHNYSLLSPSRTEEHNTAVFFHVNRQPHNDSGKATKYYRLTVQGGEIGEIQLFGLPYLPNTDGKNFPIDITEGINTNTMVLGNPLGTYVSFADERCFNLFDRNMAKKYYWGEGRTFDVEIELNESHDLDYYTLTSCQDYPNRDPKTWIVEGFDTDWEVVSQVNDFVFPCRYATMKFPVDNRKKYRGFRIQTLENNGADGFQLLKWQLFEQGGEVALENIIREQTEIYASTNKVVIDCREDSYCWVTDLSGRIVMEKQLNTGASTFWLKSGVYIVKVFSGQNSITKKVIVR